MTRIEPGDVAVIDHEDLDRVAAEALVRVGVAAVVNAAPSIGVPNLGPMILEDAGVPLVDRVGTLVLQKIREGDPVRLEHDRVFTGDRLVGVGIGQDRASIREAMESAREALDDRFEGFARNTLEYMREERDLLFGGAGLPELSHSLAGRHVLVVVRGTSYREDLAALRSYIRDVHPVLVGVDGGADALLDAGHVPDVVIGDMDSISDRALDLSQRPRRATTEIVLHAYPDGRAPGRARLERLGIRTSKSARRARARTSRSSSRTSSGRSSSLPWARTGTCGSSWTRAAEGCPRRSSSGCAWERSWWMRKAWPACTRAVRGSGTW